MIKWKRDSNPSYILAKINDCIHVDENGRFSLLGFEIHEYEIILLSMLTPLEHIPENKLFRLYFDSLKRAYQNSGKVTKDSFLAHFNKLAKALSERPEKKFHILTTISLDLRHFSRQITHDGIDIQTKPQITKAIYKKFIETTSEAKNHLHANLAQNYQLIRLTASARSEDEAVDKALRTINFFRGIWNFHITYHRFRFSSGKNYPLNKVLLGPIHFLYESKSRTAKNNSYWYDSDYFGPVSPTNLTSHKSNELIRFQKWILNRIKKSGYRDFLFDLFYRYAISLDHLNYSDAFIKLWSVLEYATGTINLPYSIAVRRCSSIYKDSFYPNIVLNHLREARNSLVHGWHHSRDTEQLLCMLKAYVEDMILFHIENRFSTYDEAVQFMEANCNKDKIYHDLKLLKKHLKDPFAEN